jgi:hypothetical protein
MRITHATALLGLLGQTGALLHGVLIEHAQCPEHGDTVHVGDSMPATAHGAASAGERGPAVRGTDDARAEAHGHEHCLGVCERRSATVTPDACTVVPIAFVTDVRRAPREIARAATRPLYLLAPKNSPPV